MKFEAKEHRGLSQAELELSRARTFVDGLIRRLSPLFPDAEPFRVLDIGSAQGAVVVWALAHRPALVGHTGSPAQHWWTPRKAARLLRAAGFTAVVDRWTLNAATETGRLRRPVLRAARRSAAIRFALDVVAEGCAFAAVKPGGSS